MGQNEGHDLTFATNPDPTRSCSKFAKRFHMNGNSGSTTDIELVGFSSRERTLIASIFKVSSLPQQAREYG